MVERRAIEFERVLIGGPLSHTRFQSHNEPIGAVNSPIRNLFVQQTLPASRCHRSLWEPQTRARPADLGHRRRSLVVRVKQPPDFRRRAEVIQRNPYSDRPKLMQDGERGLIVAEPFVRRRAPSSGTCRLRA
jgi:hypothetical protein